jgi:hypothetical protein
MNNKKSVWWDMFVSFLQGAAEQLGKIIIDVVFGPGCGFAHA